jgi:5'(3')-deoxyribonucleotidase
VHVSAQNNTQKGTSKAGKSTYDIYCVDATKNENKTKKSCLEEAWPFLNLYV